MRARYPYRSDREPGHDYEGRPITNYGRHGYGYAPQHLPIHREKERVVEFESDINFDDICDKWASP